MWTPVNLMKLSIETPRELGTLKRHIVLIRAKRGVLVIDGDITGFHCGICDQWNGWKHFHSKREG